jgi:hypothetical protein
MCLMPSAAALGHQLQTVEASIIGHYDPSPPWGVDAMGPKPIMCGYHYFPVWALVGCGRVIVLSLSWERVSWDVS